MHGTHTEVFFSYVDMHVHIRSVVFICPHQMEDVYGAPPFFNCKHRQRHAEPLVNVPDFKGWTPLHYACSENNLELVLVEEARQSPGNEAESTQLSSLVGLILLCVAIFLLLCTVQTVVSLQGATGV